MSSELRWSVSQSACCFYAADCLQRGRTFDDTALVAALAEPVGLLSREIENAGAAPDRLWAQLVPLAAQIENNPQLAKTALRKAVGSSARTETLAPRLAGRIADLETAMRRVRPDLVDGLAEQVTTLSQQWEPHALAVLDAMGRWTDPCLIPDRADVVLVPELCGGGGLAHLSFNSVWFEAVSRNPLPDLPESIRLAWLLAQLNVDLPMFSENIPAARRGILAGLAMVPPVLAAAEELELAHFDGAALLSALQAWTTGPLPSAAADTLAQWWQTCIETRPPFGVAFSALDRMLSW